MERLFILPQGSKKDVFKCNELLTDGWHIGQTIQWPDSTLMILFRDESEEEEGWRKGKDEEEGDE